MYFIIKVKVTFAINMSGSVQQQAATAADTALYLFMGSFPSLG